MAFASGSRHEIRYVEEATFGTTPASPEMINLRNAGTSLVLSKESYQSNELRSDRQISDFRHGTKQSNGDINIELSYGDFDAFLESALYGTWTTDVLKAGTTRKSFTIERAFEDISVYEVFTGCQANTLNLSVTTGGMVTGSFGIVGTGISASGAPLDATPTTSQTASPFDGFTGVLKEGGSVIGSVESFDMTLDNGLSAKFVLGSDTAAEVTSGRSNLTGSISVYFEDLTMFNKFVNETESSLEITLGNGTSESYVILLPRIKYSGADNAVTNEDSVMMNMPFQALLDPTEGTNIKITRIP